MTQTNLEMKFNASVLDLGACSVGQNLNVLTVRGFAKLDEVASISGPDVFDAIKNKTGTQRNLNMTHSKEAAEYALGSLTSDSRTDARAFPEVILNARDLNVLEFYNLDSPDDAIVLDETDPNAALEGLRIVGLRIKLSKIVYPVEKFQPQISRVDGNHRLSAAQLLIDRKEDGEAIDFPEIPFSMYVGLGKLQEIKLFTDINGEHVGMEPAILKSFEYELAGENAKDDPEMRSLWIAVQLASEAGPFANMVSFGGDKTGYKEQFGKVAPLKINSLEGAVKLLLKQGSALTAHFSGKPEVMLSMVSTYYFSVKKVFPEAWGDNKNFILLQSIGLNSFAKLGGFLIDNGIMQGTVEATYFESFLMAVRSGVSLEKSAWEGVAGAGGASRVASALIEAATPENAAVHKIIAGAEPAAQGLSVLQIEE